uniref:Uncharacterized protein n=1 Tax=Shigella sonnei TaxID=624 RepID=A0A896Z5E8_SHISO|nr:hypothetical protein NOOHOHFM_00016 [Shigella sonnei]
MGWQKCSGIKRSYLASQNLQTYCYHFEGRFGLIQALLYNLHSKFCGLSAGLQQGSVGLYMSLHTECSRLCPLIPDITCCIAVGYILFLRSALGAETQGR